MVEECQTPDFKNTGLRGMVIASTRISDVQSEATKLIYRGYLIEDLAEEATFEEVAHLLLNEKLPSEAELKDFKARLVKERAIPEELLAALRLFPKDALPMDVLQSSVAFLAAFDPDIEDTSKEASVRMGIRLIAKFATVVAAWDRIRKGDMVVPPSDELGHAANFLYMLSGKPPEDQVGRFMDICLTLHAEHSFNASTFGARKVSSTQAHLYAAVAAAVGSLSGPLHGGANTRVMKMLKEIGDKDKIDSYIKEQLDAGGKIMGLGHAVYKNGDPRARILAPMSKKLGELTGESKWYEMSAELEEKTKAAFKEKKGIEIFPNVDFYSATVYNAMGIPMDLFTPVFAVSRISGWVAHVVEEKFAEAAPKPMLYRPKSEYVGDYCGPEECAWEPIDKR